MTFESCKRKITHLEEDIKSCIKSTNGSSFRKSTVTNKTQSEPQSCNTCTENNIPFIVSERSPPDLLEASIRKIVVHTIDNVRAHVTTRENENNTN